MDPEVQNAKRGELERILADLYRITPQSSRFEPFYQSAMHAIFWLEDALKSLPNLPTK